MSSRPGRQSQKFKSTETMNLTKAQHSKHPHTGPHKKSKLPQSHVTPHASQSSSKTQSRGLSPFQQQATAVPLLTEHIPFTLSHSAAPSKNENNPALADLDSLAAELKNESETTVATVPTTSTDVDNLLEELQSVDLSNSNTTTQRAIDKSYECTHMMSKESPHERLLHAERLISRCIKERSPHLDLSNLGLTAIPSLKGLEDQLETLDLRNNKLKTIEKDSLRNLNSLTEVNLSSNAFREFNSTSIKEIEGVKVINISHNPLQYPHSTLSNIKEASPRSTVRHKFD